MKRARALFLVLALGCGLVLAGCGGGNPPTPATTWDDMNWDDGEWG